MLIACEGRELYCHISTKAGFMSALRARMRQAMKPPHVLRRHPAGGKSQSRTARYWCSPSYRTVGGRRTRGC